MKEIGMKNLDEFLDKLEEKNEEKNEEKIEEKNEEKIEEKNVEKKDKEKHSKNDNSDELNNNSKKENEMTLWEIYDEYFFDESISKEKFERLADSAVDLPKLREQKKFKDEKNAKKWENLGKYKDIIEKIKNDELLQKHEKLMLKFQQKYNDIQNLNNPIKNLDKYAINYIEEKMENIEENYYMFVDMTLRRKCYYRRDIICHSLYDGCREKNNERCSNIFYEIDFGYNHLFENYKKAVTYFYNDKANNYFRHFLGNDFFDEAFSLGNRYYILSSFAKSIISNKIKNLLDGVKRNIPSGWKITSKSGYFRIEPQGEKLKEIELPIGKSSIFMEGIYKNINESLKLNSTDGNVNIKNKGKVTQDNLKKIYEDAFNMIMNKVVENKFFEKKEQTDSMNQELINFVKKIENETEGFANIKSKKISNILLDLNNNERLTQAKGAELNQMLSSNISKCKEEINNLIQEEIKLSKNQIKPQFILLLDVSEKMEDFVEDFVRKILYKVLLKLGFEDNDKIQIYTFNSEDTSNMAYSLKKLKKFSFDCEGDILFAEAFKSSLNEMSKINNNRYYLLTVLSGNIKDKDEIRSIAFKSIGLSAKIFIKSRVVRVNLNNQNIDNDEITDGLLQQISSGDLKVYKPIEIDSNKSNEEIIQKIVDYFR